MSFSGKIQEVSSRTSHVERNPTDAWREPDVSYCATWKRACNVPKCQPAPVYVHVRLIAWLTASCESRCHSTADRSDLPIFNRCFSLTSTKQSTAEKHACSLWCVWLSAVTTVNYGHGYNLSASWPRETKEREHLLGQHLRMSVNMPEGKRYGSSLSNCVSLSPHHCLPRHQDKQHQPTGCLLPW